MDILLTHGYYLLEDPHEQAVMKPYPPLGILYISAYLQSVGFEVEVFDTTFSSKEKFRNYIQEHRPQVVGFYSNLMTRVTVLDMIQNCKAMGSTIVVGGPEPANYVEEYLRSGADIVVIGEGEHTLEELIPQLAESNADKLRMIPGIAFRDEDGQIVYTVPRAQIEDLDSLPYPDRDAVDIQRYVDVWRSHHGTGSVSLITARGCPYKCKWCSHSVFGYTHRRRSPANVAAELENVQAAYEPDIVWYADDVFTINHRWLYEYHEELKRRKLYTPFETISREDRLDERVVATLAEMGCFRLWIGSESGSQEILDSMERRTDAARVREMTHLLQKYGIQAGMFIMIGYAGETIHHLEETVAHLKDAHPDVFLTTLAYPIKGTPYYGEVADKVIPLKSWAEGSDRDFTIAGRHSRRFYSFATRWMVNEVALDKARTNNHISLPNLARIYINAKIGRIGMTLTKNQQEMG
jgi:radical SAM superfamily enzyme YgiQ (UPF0313 family)